ncbi:PE family protein [Mycobacterium asiaticum]|uniref:PE family protein n=1 Tax=Mycobacterium asiaticum TaxID=1790 RepID=UPI000563F55E|nr:PE family protein [Mycobacterium asiaticum]ORA10017.1 PE family protein [Mycobacterium asiaticum DSM 44297]
MSFVVTTPEWVTTAAENLAGIGSTLEQATASAASPTTGLAAAAADEVSAAISRVFGAFGEEFQAVSAQGAAFHAEFIRLMSSSAAAYAGAEIANAAQTLASISNGTSVGTAAPAPGGAYAQLVVNTANNLQALGNSWAANPFPFLRQVAANQLSYAQQAITGFANTIQNLPAIIANLPTTVPAAIQQFLNINFAARIQQFIATQAGFAQTFLNATSSGLSGLVAGLPAFASGVQTSFQTLVTTGNYNAAIAQLADAYRQLLITGYDVSNYSVNFDTTTLTLTGTAYPKLVGPLNDFFTVLNIPAQEAQYFTDLMPPSIPRQISQNFTNVLSALTATNVEAKLVAPFLAPQTAFVSLTYSVPLITTYALAGPPFAALDAFTASLVSFNQAISAGNAVGAVSTLIDAPANILNGFLNGQVIVNDTILVPTGLNDVVIGPVTIPLPHTISITPHIPFDGLLVQPHYLTATVGLPGYVPPPPFPPPPDLDFTVFGTPFMGLGPLLVNYVPQQLALAIRPPG